MYTFGIGDRRAVPSRVEQAKVEAELDPGVTVADIGANQTDVVRDLEIVDEERAFDVRRGQRASGHVVERRGRERRGSSRASGPTLTTFFLRIRATPFGQARP